jgi:hypothetical protein
MAPGEHNLALLRRGLLLEYTTLAWNVVGTVIVVVAAIEARSVALAGFALDSLIEIFASTIVVWQIRGVDLNRERPALRLIGGAFFLLAVYVVLSSPCSRCKGTSRVRLTPQTTETTRNRRKPISTISCCVRPTSRGSGR